MSVQFLDKIDGIFWLLFTSTILLAAWILISTKGNKKLFTLSIIRTVVLIILLILMVQPKLIWKEQIREDLKWNIYVDRSVSMGYHRSISPNSYINGVTSLISSISEKVDHSSVYYFDYELKRNDSFELIGGSTDLGLVVDHINKNQKFLAGSIIITDGNVTKGAQNLLNIADIQIPIHTIGVGDTIPMIDISIQEIDAPTVVVKGEDIGVNVHLSALGLVDNRINVLLYKNKNLIGSKNVHLSGGGSISDVKFIVNSNDIGENIFSVNATVLKDEINIDNNKRDFTVTVLKDRYRVALITGSPNFNTVPIKRIITEIPRIELDHYTQNKEQFVPSINLFWSTPYELIILDNFPVEPLSYKWQQILGKKIISQRSGLFIFAGPNTNVKSFETVSPLVHAENFEYRNSDQVNWHLTKDELNDISINNIELIDLPPITPMLHFQLGKNHRPLAYYDNTENPVIYIGEEDELRFGIWTSSDFFNGYFKLTNSDNKDLMQTNMSEIFSWILKMGGSEDLYFRFNKDIYQQGEEIKLIGTHYSNDFKDISSMSGFVHLTDSENDESKHEFRFDPVNNMWKVEILAGKPGNYNYEIILENNNQIRKQNGTFIIDKSQIELNNVSLNKRIISEISSITNGNVYNWNTRADIINEMSNKKLNDIIVKAAKLNENYYLLILIIILLTIEWYIRRLIGYN